MSYRLSVSAVVWLALAAASPAFAQHSAREGGASVEDRAAVAACLKLANENGEREAKKADPEDEKPGAAGRLEAAAKHATMAAESCNGAVSAPCMQQPDGQSTAGMINCLSRELAVWDERLNSAYQQSLKDASPKLAAALREIQRAWLRWRDLRCKLPVLEHEGGTIAGPLTASCLLEMTAQQAIWLDPGSR